MIARFVEVLFLLPSYFMIEINMLYVIMMMNSMCMYMMSYILTQRVAVALQYEHKKIRLNQMGLALLIFMAILGWFIPEIIFNEKRVIITCNEKFVYRK